jgi:hypothetical protein
MVTNFVQLMPYGTYTVDLVMLRDLAGWLADLQATLPRAVRGQPRDISYRAEYSLTGGCQSGSSSWLRLESSWSGQAVGPLLDSPPLEGRTVLRASLGPGEERLTGAAQYTELETLRALLTGLTAGQFVWNSR